MARVEEADQPVGAAFVTLIPPADLDHLWSMRWETHLRPTASNAGSATPI